MERGTKLGPYEILDPLGAGGMGEVYKARDTRLDRIVAIKVLPAKFAEHPEFRQRLEREARTVSSLNHPHICALYDIGRQDNIDFLVLEYLEGETLTNRLRKGPLPVDLTLRYAIEIAGALDRAHRHGIVHRDLKPGNIMLTRSGAKLLDFGLAKVRETVKAGDAEATAALTHDLTSPGAILGTFQYMPPEQLEGRDADARSDIFAFGAVLYEMLTGHKAFDGKSQASLIASILTGEPAPLPGSLGRVVRVCMAKEPDDRWQSAGDLARELKWIGEAGASAETPQAAPQRVIIPWAVAALAVLATLSVSWIHLREPAPERTSIRFTVQTQAKLPSAIKISPDGTKVAFLGQNAEGKSVMWLRPLDKLDELVLPGTEGADTPFWSPDSRQIAFFDRYYRGHLKRIDISGGQPQTICDTPGGIGGDWGKDGTIIFASQGGIFRVSAAGGTAVQIIALAGTKLQFPVFLPDSKHFLLSESSWHRQARGEPLMMVGSMDSKETKPVVASSYNGAFSAASGHLLFVRDGALMAQALDLRSLSLRGDAVRVADAVATEVPLSVADFSVSKNGVLAFNAAVYQHELVWLDRHGNRLSAGVPATRYAHPTLSPDDKQVVFEGPDSKATTNRLWKLDVDRGEVSLFDDQGNLPVFLPDGRAVAYVCQTAEKTAICRKNAGGAGDTEVLWQSGDAKSPVDFTRDGRFLSYIDQTQGRQLWILPLTGDRKPFRFHKSEAFDRFGVFSPDGKWIAYASSETGDYNVYVEPFPPTGDKRKVSTQGGAQPRWRGDGKELFYRTEDGKMMAVSVKTVGSFEAGAPQVLFQSSADPLYPNLGIAYAVTADGQRFLVNAAKDESRTPPITIVTNWTAALK